ncbi:MAG: hypothetical protein FE047_00715 [Thermoplasmata archaeon]|nr:MAG: hypothetical protein FE047_00715 [Thermoplasmata archaeon]
MKIWLFRESQTAKDLKESLFSLTFCTFGDLITGVTIGYFTDLLNALPALIILIPPAIGMRGNIFASLGSRLGSYLHTGEIVIGGKSNLLKENIKTSFALTFSMSIYIGFLAWIVAKWFGMEKYFGRTIDVMDLSLISLFAGIFSAFIMIFFTFLITFLSYKKGWNPDNLTAPLITLAGDIITLPLLFFSMKVVSLFYDELKIVIFIAFLIITFTYTFLSSRTEASKRILAESLPVLAICGLLSIFSGSILGSKFEGIMGISAILTILPAFLEDGGAIGGILAARFSSSLHIGEIKYEKKPSKKVIRLFIVMHIVGLIIFPLIGIFGYVAGTLIGLPGYNLLKMILISLTAGEILVIIVNFLSYYLSTISFKIGVNPDNVVIPILTSLMDFVGTACLIGVAFLYL